MSTTAINVNSMSKRYRIGLPERSDRGVRGAMLDSLTAPFRRWRELSSPATPDEQFWALRGVSFNVSPGEVVGIIGRNGSGKSTLLKILSRITEPTEGRAVLQGRVGSLLEVCTGFHRELTGRENIYLSGALLGMSRADITRQLDAIAEFAGIGRFLHTPVKRYSSGMYVRLAFAVAAHLQPEILLIDEVLAVGDAGFQKKCLGKMGDVAREGRTVLFVSHNMAAIQALCDRVIVLHDGELIADTTPNEGTNIYLSRTLSSAERDVGTSVDLREHPGRPRGQAAVLRHAWMQNVNGDPCGTIRMGEGLRIGCTFENGEMIHRPEYSLCITTSSGTRVFSVHSAMVSGDSLPDTVSRGTMTFEFDTLPLLPGEYQVGIAISDRHHKLLDFIEQALTLQVEPADVYGTGRVPVPTDGVIYHHGRIRYQPEMSH